MNTAAGLCENKNFVVSKTKNEDIYTNSLSMNLLLLMLGSGICAWSLNNIIIEHHFLSGGFTGFVLIIHYLFQDTSVWALYLILNIPVYIMGWFYVGKRFFFYSVAGLLIFTLFVKWIDYPVVLDDRFLAAIFGGLVNGLGGGIILRSVGSAGGMDILSVILLKRFSIRIGSTLLAFNTAILCISACLFTLEDALYTLIYMYVMSKVVDVVVTGLSRRRAVIIISDHWEEIADAIFRQINRTVTMIPANGGFSGKKENILYTVVSFRDVSLLKTIVKTLDPKVFVVVTDTLEVMGGLRIANQPHW